ncbi:MAG TPA: lysylphosphatidylglycerol synthase transmembrane domain-containing protein [Gemmatimonadales bacterium]|nr:lysylphosphatidylglycerol synthase transmembrane domain-containing protein [Gemmatimonadales bacterium]
MAGSGSSTAARPASARAGRGRLWRASLGLVVSLALVAVILAKVDEEQVWRHLRDARPLPLVVAVILATIPFGLRVFRWRILLRADGGGAIPYRPLWHAIAMGFTANNVLPLRAGEVVRTYAISRLAGVRFATAFSSVAVERVFDGMAVILLFAVGLFLSGLPAGTTIGGVAVASAATKAGIAVVAALLLAALVVGFPHWAERAVRAVVPASRLADRLVGLIEGVVHGLHVLRSPGRIAAVALWSLALWTVNGLSFYAAFFAFDIPVGVAGALLLQGLLIIGISLPSTPGYVGVFEGVVIAALAVYGISSERALSYALAYHVTTFLPITLLGAWSLARTNLGLRQLGREAKS